MRLGALRWLLLLSLATLGLVGPVRAHPLSPASVLLREQASAHYELTIRRSAAARDTLELLFPAGCRRVHAAPERREEDAFIEVAQLVCAAPLEGQVLRAVGLAELGTGLLLQLEPRDGEPVRAFLSAHTSSFRVPQRATALTLLGDYVRLGIEHLISGLDHVLFVLGLMLLVRDLRGRVLALSSFTLGHSVTLCLSALSIVQLPQGPVEIGIAASLLMVALEVLALDAQRAGQTPLLSRRSAVMAASFGLLHGLGFASALSDAGLPERAVALALFGFNVGVELGQLALVLALVALTALARGPIQARAPWLRRTAAYAIGALAAMWCIERTIATFS